MIVPTMIEGPFVDKDGNLTDQARKLMEQLLQNMQQNLSQEGIVVPSQDAAAIATIAAGVDSNGSKICQPGTLLFDTSLQPGTGQLVIFMTDGSFHPITNT